MQEHFDGNGDLEQGESITRVTGMYKDWFLDYASYVFLERAVPSVEDGFKPVQRRIMQSMKDLDDGRYNKVANIVGHTMQYHPHGDASIADAMVQIGQKDLLIDTQGNWGNILTGDRAAASRYIEARLSKFGIETFFPPIIFVKRLMLLFLEVATLKISLDTLLSAALKNAFTTSFTCIKSLD